MSRVPCPIDGCDHPARSGYMCGGCQAELARALDAVPEVVRELDTTLAKQHTRTGGGGGDIEDDRAAAVLHIGPLPYDRRASEVGWILRNTLVGWVRQLQEAQPEHWPADTPHSMAGWLSERLQRLVRHPAAEEAHGEIVSAVRAAERVVDRPAGYVYAGPCGECGYALYAKPGATTVPCRQPDCPAKPVNVTERRDWMRQQCEDLLGTASEVSMICAGLGVTVSPSTIRVWVTRKKIFPRRFVRPIKEGGKPRALYRVGDVIKRAAGVEDDQAYTVEGESYVVG